MCGSHAGVRQMIGSRPDAQTLAHFERVCSLERPRPVQLNQEARHARTVVRILPVGLWLIAIHDMLFADHPICLGAHGPVEARLASAFFFGCGALMWFNLPFGLRDKRQLSLMKNGKIALGRVTGPSSRPVNQGITYEFADWQGSTVQGRGADIHGMLNEDDYVLVLYDPQKTQESIALCATYYEFVDPRFPLAAVPGHTC